MDFSISKIRVEDLVQLDSVFDRAEVARRTGIHYQTLSGKINRHKQGKPTSLSIQQMDKLTEFFLDAQELLVLCLTNEPANKPDRPDKL